MTQNPSLGVLNCIYLAKYKCTFVKKGGGPGVPSYHVLYVHEYFWRKTRSVLPMGSSQDVTCAKVRAVRVVSVQQGTDGTSYFTSTLSPDTRVKKSAHWLAECAKQTPSPRPIGGTGKTLPLRSSPIGPRVSSRHPRSFYRKLPARRCCSGWGSITGTVACDWFLRF